MAWEADRPTYAGQSLGSDIFSIKLLLAIDKPNTFQIDKYDIINTKYKVNQNDMQLRFAARKFNLYMPSMELNLYNDR